MPANKYLKPADSIGLAGNASDIVGVVRLPPMKAIDKIPANINIPRITKPTIERNFAHLAASDKCDFADGSMLRPKSWVVSFCSIEVFINFYKMDLNY